MATTRKTKAAKTKPEVAQVIREYGPFSGAEDIAGVTFDGSHVWIARGESLAALDPQSGELRRELAIVATAGTAFDGKHLWQIADDCIQKIDPVSGQVLATIPAPASGRDSGLTWAEGTLWVGEYRARKIHQINPDSGEILRTIESDRFVTGVSWTDGELWYGAMDDAGGELRQVDPQNGDVITSLTLPEGIFVSGIEADGAGLFYCGGGASGKLRVVRKPARRPAD